ncbi:GEM-like protein 1 [Telopea speciosissima]|uniref:GEM-like protein 1 n=1 Tax=Telopea speciosissima TaxID=54955 RepID=UPI001CC78DB9|nr:GEM-like protein 1 [Telopea speciosissima]
MDPTHQSDKENKKMDAGTPNSNTEGRWGTWVMGAPVPPQDHPANQKAATWVAGEAIPSSDPATLNADYMKYSVPPVTSENVGGGNGGSSSSMPQPQPANPYVQTSSVPGSSGKSPMEMILNVLSRWGKKFEGCAKKAEGFTGNVWHHLKTSPSLTDAAMARLAQWTKILREGGHEKVFQQTFQLLPEEKLMKAYACYLSSSSGPVIGTLYISNKRVAFCSDNPLCHCPTPGQKEWLYYKVSLPLDQLAAVNPSSNKLNPSEKYIQVVTADGHEFWFMGFVSYDKALKNLTEALQHQGAVSSGNQQN